MVGKAGTSIGAALKKKGFLSRMYRDLLVSISRTGIKRGTKFPIGIRGGPGEGKNVSNMHRLNAKQRRFLQKAMPYAATFGVGGAAGYWTARRAGRAAAAYVNQYPTNLGY